MHGVTGPLRIHSGNLDGSTIPQRVQEPGQLQSPVLSSRVASEQESNLESTATPGAKYLLQGVKESPNFPLLKSVADDLCSILDNCEVWFPTPHLICNAYGFSSKRR